MIPTKAPDVNPVDVQLIGKVIVVAVPPIVIALIAVTAPLWSTDRLANSTADGTPRIVTGGIRTY